MRKYFAYMNDTKIKRWTYLKRFLTDMGRLHIDEVVMLLMLMTSSFLHMCMHRVALTHASHFV